MLTGEIYRFNVGQLECAVICDMDRPIGMDGMNRRFPSVPPSELEQAVNQVGVTTNNYINILFIHTPEHNILVDTSDGREDSRLIDSLLKAGVKPDDIDRIIITHSHGDHIDGIVKSDGSLAFPNARYSVWKSEWEYWLSEVEKSDDPQNLARRIQQAIRDRVDLIEHESEILPGVCALPMPGHTPGHMGLLLDSDGERLLHVVDSVHHPIQAAHPEWSPRFDMQPDVSVQTRRALFERAARENLLVMTYHFRFPGLGYVKAQDAVFRWEAIAV